MQITDFRLSNLGKDFYARNQLPGKSKDVQVEYVFEPLSDSWSAFKKTTSKSANSNSVIEIDEKTFQPSNINVEIRHCLEQDSYPWKTALTEIGSVYSTLDETQQNLQILKLTVGKDGNLFLEADDKTPDLQQWLKQVKPEYIKTTILTPAFLKVNHTNTSIAFSIASIFSNSSKSASKYPQLNADKLKTAIKTCPVNDLDINLAIKKLLPENAFFIIALQRHPAFEELATPHLILSEELSESLIWIAKDKAAIAQAIQPKNLPDDLLALIFPAQEKSPIAVFLGEAQLYWAGQAVKGLVATQQDGAEIDAIWQQIQKHLESTLKSSYDPRVLALSLFWNPPEIVINRWLEIHIQDSLEKLLQFGNEFEEAMQQVTKVDYSKQWQTAFSDKLSEKIALINSFKYQDLCNHINAISDKLPNFKMKLHAELLGKATSIKKQAELVELRKLVGTSIQFPETLLDKELIIDWVNSMLLENPIELAPPHSWFEDLESCRQQYQNLIRNIGEKPLNVANESRELAQGSLNIKALESAKQWLKTTAKLRERCETIYQNTRLRQLEEQVKNWKFLVECHMIDPLPSYQQWIVFDTSALLDSPTLLDNFDKDIKVALPLKVLDELDIHKHDKREENKEKAATAQRIIKKIELFADYILKIQHVPQLLPAEHFETPSSDDMIISAARSLLLSPVLFVSSDVNQRNKAKSLGLDVVATSDFKKPANNQQQINSKIKKTKQRTS